nr:HAD-IB family phosphatase [Shewanella pneumatophori]
MALFDFDGTLTNKDMFTKFIFFSATPMRLALGVIFMSPLYLLYKMGVIPARKLRPFVSYCAFAGRDKQTLDRLGVEYATKIIPRYLRPEMQQTLKQYQAEGASIVVVSASLDLYLKPWCQIMGLELICSEMATEQVAKQEQIQAHNQELNQEPKNSRYTGFYVAGDCSCEAKASKVSERFNLKDYSYIYAYGDTKEDLAMLALADEAYMQGVTQSLIE